MRAIVPGRQGGRAGRAGRAVARCAGNGAGLPRRQVRRRPAARLELALDALRCSDAICRAAAVASSSVVHRPVHLLFVDGFQDLSDARAGREAELEEMTAEENRAGRLVFDAELARAVEKPVHRRAVEVAGLAAEAVGLGEPGEQLEIDLVRRAGGTRRRRPRRGPCTRRPASDAARRGRRPAGARRSRRSNGRSADRETTSPARRLVPRDRASGSARRELRGRRLAEVVAHGAEHHRQLLRPRQIVDALVAPDRRPAACGPRRRLRDATRAPADIRRARGAPETAARRCRGRAPARGRRTAAARAAASRFRPRCARPADRRARIDRHSSRVAGRRASNSKRAAN